MKFKLSVIFLISIIIFSCDFNNYTSNPPPSSQYQCIAVNKDSFLLRWDYSGEYDAFQVYYRSHSSNIWFKLKETNTKQLVINNSLLNYGVYDFAVSAILNGEESELHSSLEKTAIPSTGWYVRWAKP
jgi:hypothetical protein